MPYIVETVSSVGAGSSAQSISIGSPLTNDLILILAAISGSATYTTPTGYSLLYVSTNTVRQYCWYKIAASDSEADPTSTPSFSSNAAFVALIIRDVNTTTPITNTAGVGYATSTFTNVKEVAAPTLTTGASNTKNLILHAGSITVDKIVADFAKTSAVVSSNNGGCIFVAKEWIETALTSSASFNWLTNQSSSRTGNLAVISINNKTSGGDGLRDISCLMTHTRLVKPYPYGTSETLSAPNTILVGATPLDGLVAASAAAAVSSTGTLSNSYLTSLNISSATSFGADTWTGFSWPTPSTLDFTGKIIGFAWNPGQPWSASTTDARGIAIVFSDSAGNWVAYKVRDLTTSYINLDHIKFISPGVSEEYGSSGTITWSDITNITWIYARQSGQTNQSVLNIASLYLFDGVSTLVGGSVVKPINGNQIFKHVNQYIDTLGTSGLYPLASFQGLGQFLGYAPIQIGNGSIPTYLKLLAGSLETPPESTRTNDYYVTDAAYGITLYGSSTCVFDLRSATIASSNLQIFRLHPSSSLSASILTTGTSFIGRTFVEEAGYPWISTSWADCDTVAFKNSALTSCTIYSPNAVISGTTGAVVSFSADGAVITGSSISCTKADGTSTGYHIELGASLVAISLIDVDLLGTPGTSKIHLLATVGNVEITIDGITLLTDADITSDGATWDIIAPTLKQSVSLTGLSTTCRVQLYDTDALEELYNGEPGTTSYTWTDPIAATAARPIRLRITDYKGATADVMVERNIGTCGITEGTEAISFNHEAEADSNYAAHVTDLGINGADITDIEIVDTTNKVKFNYTAGGDYDARRIYMYMVYWLDTEAGIRDDFVFCRPLDPVNLPMEGVLFENITSPQEIITFINAYVYDSVTGRAKDLVVGDGINFAPDHVVNSVITVGGVNIITGDIDEIAAKVQEGLTAQGYTTTRADKLDNLDRKISRTLVTQIATRK